MQQSAELLLALGGILLLGLISDFLGKRSFLPRVTLLLLFGIIAGDGVLGLIPASLTNHFELITNTALLMIGFLLGGKLTLRFLKSCGRQLIGISAFAALGTTAVVSVILVAVGVPLEVALLLGCIATATDPAASAATVVESGEESHFAKLLLGIVAIDDAWALLLFSFGLALVSLLNGNQTIAISLLHVSYDIGGAMLLGVVIGLPAAYLTGRLKPGRPMLTEALGLVLLCGGAAQLLGVSLMIAAITMGAIIANFARHHEYPFHEIENIEWPFMIVFFLVAGALLEIATLRNLGVIGLTYVLARIAGKLIGAWLGSRISQADKAVSRWMGVALMPQAGVAVGMALISAARFPEHRQIILSIAVGTTVLFELFGPMLTRLALTKARQLELDS